MAYNVKALNLTKDMTVRTFTETLDKLEEK